MRSPLRYPGGKTRAIRILKEYIPQGTTTIISPFFGGGSFELSTGLEILANDLFVPLFDFWTHLQRDADSLIGSVRSEVPVTKEKFHALRSVPITPASFFIINRTSFSGSTFCGGFSQQSADGRLTESSLERLKSVNLNRVRFSNLDCVRFLEANPPKEGHWIYADPPYYITNYIYGRDGDLHQSFDHESLRDHLKGRQDWLLSYNDCEYIRELYKEMTIESVSWAYGMNSSKKSSEILIYPKRQPAI